MSRAGSRPLPKAVRDLLAAYPPPVHALAVAARKLVLEVVPAAQEMADPPDKLIGYGFGPRMAELVCVIMPLQKGVNLGLPGGATLPDPAGLLSGTGKRHRHVRLNTLSDVESPALRALLAAAAAVRQPG